MKPLANALLIIGRAFRFLWTGRFEVNLCVTLFMVFIVLAGSGCMGEHERAGLVIVNGIEPESLDPAIITGVAEMRIVAAMFEGLTRLEPVHARAVPGLAESWEISEDGRTYTFTLRGNLHWSTGEPITANDVVYSWIRALDPLTASDYAGQLFFITNAEAFNAGRITDHDQVGVHALDEHTVRVELNNPTPFFLDLCAFPTLCVVPRQSIEKHGDQWIMKKPLPVSGAYELDYWRINDRIRLRRNSHYWDAANTRTEVVDFLPIGSPNTALNLYETGGADIVWDKDLVPVELVDRLIQRPDFHTFDYLGTYFIRFNVTRPPFDDVRVRKALSLSVDKARITEKITRAGERPTHHFVPRGVANYESPEGLSHDPDLARKLLAEAGYPGGKSFPRFQYTFNAAAGGAAKLHAKIAVELQQMWRDELGIEMELRQVEWKVYLAAQAALDYEISRSSWIGDYNDANTFLDMFMSNNGNNRTGWSSDRYDELIRGANKTTDITKRKQLFQEAEAMLIRDEVPILPIFFYIGFNYYDPDEVKGIYPNILDQHPVQFIYRMGRGARDEGRKIRSSGREEALMETEATVH